VWVWVCACVPVCVRACVRVCACVRARVRVCLCPCFRVRVCGCGSVFVWFCVCVLCAVCVLVGPALPPFGVSRAAWLCCVVFALSLVAVAGRFASLKFYSDSRTTWDGDLCQRH